MFTLPRLLLCENERFVPLNFSLGPHIRERCNEPQGDEADDLAAGLPRDPNDDNAKFHAKIVEVEIGGVAIYPPFGEFRRANSYCHLYGAQGLGVLLVPCHDEFRRPRSDYIRQVALATTTTFKCNSGALTDVNMINIYKRKIFFIFGEIHENERGEEDQSLI
ncbi:hypothetical protein TNCV_4705201 [Trichonephila clavipes]|nr:hypothetical protein TNCV_4705201 [Trichonephila clavipes]